METKTDVSNIYKVEVGKGIMTYYMTDWVNKRACDMFLSMFEKEGKYVDLKQLSIKALNTSEYLQANYAIQRASGQLSYYAVGVK